MADSATAWAKASRVEEETSAAPGRSAVAAAKAGEAPSTRSATTKSHSDGPASTEKRARPAAGLKNKLAIKPVRYLDVSWSLRSPTVTRCRSSGGWSGAAGAG